MPTDEVCDGIDNDCDGVPDNDAVDASIFFADRDGDGFGDASAPRVTCELEEGLADNDQDCDDTRPDVNPGAVERCDGIDNDCDPASSEAGTATFQDGTGGFTDVTEQLTGDPEAPASLVLSEDGVLSVCEGIFFARLEVAADVNLSGFGDVVIDAGGRVRHCATRPTT